MRFQNAEAFRASLEQRLRDESQVISLPLQRLRKHVVFERFLARLLKVAPEGWALKGAVALNFRLGRATRTTNDLDLGSEAGKMFLDQKFQEVTEQDLGDFFEFTVAGPNERTYDALTIVRYSVEARLAGRRYDSFHLDVAIVRELGFAPEHILAPALLSFADIKPVSVPTIPIDRHIADKVHAYTRPREGRINTRVKDLADLVLLASTPHVAFEVQAIAAAIVSVFDLEPTHEMPRILPPPPTPWNTEFGSYASQMGIEVELRDINRAFEIVREKIEPALKRAEEMVRLRTLAD